MQFDDGLDTVLAAEAAGRAGPVATWRQLVDLIGRRRVRAEAVEAAVARLLALRSAVPLPVRVASAQGLARANPPAALVALFVEDEPAVAAPVVRIARLTASEWTALLPRMRTATRGVLRHRRDLSEHVERALAAYGQSDFALPAGESVIAVEEEPVAAVTPAKADDPVSVFIAPEPTPFVSLSDVARDLPVVAEALRLARTREAPAPPERGDFEIAAIVARIEAHQRAAEGRAAVPKSIEAPAVTDRFRFETDASGMIRWTDNPVRGALVGLSLALGSDHVDASAGGALARRAVITDARLQVAGTSAAAGSWRISATPAFDRASGRFIGYRGIARRPRPDEEPRSIAAPPADALRQLVHELRTPANAISGFAEMIEQQILGPVSEAYRTQAGAIRVQTGELLGAIDDIDIAARLETRSLDLRVEPVPLAPVIAQVGRDLLPLADLRGARLSLAVEYDSIVVADRRTLERLFGRLLTALVAATGRGEVINGRAFADGDMVRFDLSRPAALNVTDGALFSADAEVEQAASGAPLLGGGFAFRLARRLATELGGSLAVDVDSLTVRLPAADTGNVEQATV